MTKSQELVGAYGHQLYLHNSEQEREGVTPYPPLEFEQLFILPEAKVRIMEVRYP
jgi:hypothetical protein